MFFHQFQDYIFQEDEPIVKFLPAKEYCKQRDRGTNKATIGVGVEAVIYIGPLSGPMYKEGFFIFERSSLCFSVGFNGCLIDEHDGDIFFDRINPVAFDTLQALLIRG